jgi:hypothetical protein
VETNCHIINKWIHLLEIIQCHICCRTQQHSSTASNLTPGSPDNDTSSDQLLKNLQAIKRQQKLRSSPRIDLPEGEEIYAFHSEEILYNGSNSPLSPTLQQLNAQLKLSEVELRSLLEQFRAVSDENGLVDKQNFENVVRRSLAKRFDNSIFPAFHRIYEAFDLDG